MRRLPISVKVVPRQVKQGTSEIELRIKNLGKNKLETLEVGLNSLDQRLIEVDDPNKWVNKVDPDETINIHFTLCAHRSAMVYAKIFGYIGEERFEWESPALRLKVGEEAAELSSLLILGESSREAGTLKIETIVKVMKPNTQVTLDYWVYTPSEEYLKIGEITTSILQPGETKQVMEYIPDKKGLYTVYAYLYDKNRQIDRQSDKVYITKKT
jgi:hypothetical protein